MSRVGSGQDVFKSHGADQVGSRGDEKLTGRVESWPAKTGHSPVGPAKHLLFRKPKMGSLTATKHRPLRKLYPTRPDLGLEINRQKRN